MLCSHAQSKDSQARFAKIRSSAQCSVRIVPHLGLNIEATISLFAHMRRSWRQRPSSRRVRKERCDLAHTYIVGTATRLKLLSWGALRLRCRWGRESTPCRRERPLARPAKSPRRASGHRGDPRPRAPEEVIERNRRAQPPTDRAALCCRGAWSEHRACNGRARKLVVRRNSSCAAKAAPPAIARPEGRRLRGPRNPARELGPLMDAGAAGAKTTAAAPTRRDCRCGCTPVPSDATRPFIFCCGPCFCGCCRCRWCCGCCSLLCTHACTCAHTSSRALCCRCRLRRAACTTTNIACLCACASTIHTYS